MFFSKSPHWLQLKLCTSTIFGPGRVKGKYGLKNISTLNDTLTGRLLLYLNRNNTLHLNTKDSIGKTREILNKLCNIQRTDLINRITDLQSNCDCNTPTKFINILDSESSLGLELFTLSDIFRLLSVMAYIVPQQITNSKFYKLAINHLNNNMLSMSKDDLLKLLFFLALQKNNRFTNHWIKKCLYLLKADLESLTIEELCIICNSTFKTSTKIGNTTILNRVKHVIADNLNILNDPALFVTLIKTIRHNRYQDENILSTISYAILFNKTYNNYSFGALCHVLALYADYFYYDSQLFDIAVAQCLNLIRNQKKKSMQAHMTENIRSKDLTRFLWVLSNMNYKLNEGDFYCISCKIMEKMCLKEYIKGSGEIANCMLYLWMLNYEALEIIQYYFRHNCMENDINLKSKLRLNLLLTCIRLENPDFYFVINGEFTSYPTISTYEIKQQIRRRPSLQRVFNILQIKPTSFGLNRFEYTCEIPNLNIVGITGFKKRIYKSLFIEVLDEFTSLKNTENNENGPMGLKNRLLVKMDKQILKVPERLIKLMTKMQLEEYLRFEIKSLC